VYMYLHHLKSHARNVGHKVPTGAGKSISSCEYEILSRHFVIPRNVTVKSTAFFSAGLTLSSSWWLTFV
jgi:hypothetical protein